MKRSELLEKAIKIAQNGANYDCNCESTRELNRFALELFLAEQKREAGCDYCNGVIVARNSSFGIYQSTDKTWHISTDESDEDLYYCPKCGKRLTEGESV